MAQKLWGKLCKSFLQVDIIVSLTMMLSLSNVLLKKVWACGKIMAVGSPLLMGTNIFKSFCSSAVKVRIDVGLPTCEWAGSGLLGLCSECDPFRSIPINSLENLFNSLFGSFVPKATLIFTRHWDPLNFPVHLSLKCGFCGRGLQFFHTERRPSILSQCSQHFQFS